VIIDAHQHFWDVSRTDYGWLRPDNVRLYRNYLPPDLAPLLADNEVDATVLVQAAPSEAETRYLFQLAHAHSVVAGVVGWADFESPGSDERITKLVEDGQDKLKGLRPMIQDIPDADWVLRMELDGAFHSMSRHRLVFEALVRPSHLDALRQRLLRHPDLRVVLDHAGKPNIEHQEFELWARGIERLARDTAVSVKLSGILTEAGAHGSFEDLRPYIEHIFREFGSERIIWGSDWPVLNLASSYTDWLTMAREWIQLLAPESESAILADNAARMYRLTLRATPATSRKPRVDH
jgi:L-fuconolactonase